MSWYATSIEELERMTPVNPPKEKQIRKIKIIKKSTTIRGVNVKDETHEKILIAVGIAMIIVADEKYSLESSFIPATYI